MNQITRRRKIREHLNSSILLSLILLTCLPLILSSSPSNSPSTLGGIEQLEKVLVNEDSQSSSLISSSPNDRQLSSTTPHPDYISTGFGNIIHEDDEDEELPEEENERPGLTKHVLVYSSSKTPWAGCSEDDVLGVHCGVSGESFTEVPKNLTKGVVRITLHSTGIKELRPSSFKPYNESLKDIYIVTATKLTSIHPGVFKNLRHLQTLSIQHCPLLTHIPNGVFSSRAFKVLKMTLTGLQTLPKLNFQSQGIFEIIDIDNNRIGNLTRNGVSVRANVMSLEGNEIEFVEEAAFNGSHISKLILKDNRRLTMIDDHAFSGLHDLRTLDLSFTSITKLPTHGLDNLEILKLQGIHSLKVIPSVYDFNQISEVYMTYSYHCCAFKLPHEGSDDERIYREFSQENKKFCHNDEDSPKETTNDHHSSSSSLSISQNFLHIEQRYPRKRKRSIHDNKQHDPVSTEKNNKAKTKKRTSLDPSVKEVKRDQRRLIKSSNKEYRGKSFLSDHESSLQSKLLRIPERKGKEQNVLYGSWTEIEGSNEGRHERKLIEDQEIRRGENRQERRRTKRKPQDNVNFITGRVVDSLDDEASKTTERELLPDVHGDKQDDETLERRMPHSGNHSSPFHESIQSSIDVVQDKMRSKASSFLPKKMFKILDSFWKAYDGVPVKSSSAFDSTSRLKELEEQEDDDFSQDDEEDHDPFQENEPLHVSDNYESSQAFGNSSTSVSKSSPGSSQDAKFIFCGRITRFKRKVTCFPEPDAFNPCEDVMGNILLRISVWFVVIFAVVGNLCVIVVLMSSKFKMTVSKFLMCNLAFADFCMGAYLFMIAVVDFHTIGVYFNYADKWQHGLGCKIAGFVTVFASCLSIFTLTVITLERLYAITYAIHLNRRLRLGLAAKVMACGWVYSIVTASLPLLGVSGYEKTSICLPMETESIFDRLYLFTLLTINALAFVVICCCYAKMYHAIISQETRATVNDTTIAKRMALLVFTDFACWAPIAFFGLTAIAGYPLINVTNSKILIVFFYPLNSCSNPYLYAILTKQYRRDFFILTSRLGFCRSRAEKYKPGSTQQQWQQNQLENQRRKQRQQENNLQIASYSSSRPNPLASSQGICSHVASDPNYCRNCDGQCQRSSRGSSLAHNPRFRRNKSLLMTTDDASCDSSHSCRCIVYSAIDPLESASMNRIDSNHEIVRVECIHMNKYNNVSCNGNREREGSFDNDNSTANGICCCSKRPRSTTRSLINAIKKSFSSSDDRDDNGSCSMQRRSSLPGCQGKPCKCRLHRISKSVGNHRKQGNHAHMCSSSSSTRVAANCLGREIVINKEDDDEDSKAKNLTTSTRMSSAASATSASLVAFGLNRRKCLSSNNIHKSHKSCTSFVQRESSSSGEKSSCVSNPVSFSDDCSRSHGNHSGHHGHSYNRHHHHCKSSTSHRQQQHVGSSCGSSSCVRKIGMKASSSSCLEHKNVEINKNSNNSNSINFCRCILDSQGKGNSNDSHCPYHDHRSKGSINCISKSNSQSLHQESQL